MKTSRAHFHVFGGIFIFCLALSWPSFAEEELHGLPENAPHQTYKLTLDVESTSGAPLEARVQLYDEVGNSFWPEDPNALIYFGYTAHNYFYADGSVTADVPGGTVILAVSRGLEYASAIDTISVFCDTTLTVVLPELIDLRSQLWYSGDTHVHIAHGGVGDTYDVSPEDLALMGRAEGLGIVCALSNGLHFSGLLHPAGINDHHLYFGMEYRSALFGHMGILGLDTLLNQGCCLPGDPPYPLNYDVGVDAHEQGAVVIAAHPETMDPDEFNNTSAAWPYSGFSRELAADVVLDAVDAIELLSYSNFNNDSVINTWYNLLNLGFRISPSAGTDASVNRNFDPPIGGYRVYAKLPPSTAFTLDGWLQGIRDGRSFVTNGPLPHDVTVDGKEVGSTILLDTENPTQVLTVHVSGVSREPISSIDVVYRGTSIRRAFFPPGTTTFSTDLDVTVPTIDGWIVVRVNSISDDPTLVGLSIFALTAPIYLSGTSSALYSGLSSIYEDQLIDLSQIIGDRPEGTAEEKSAAIATLNRARQKLLGKQVSDDDDQDDVLDHASHSHEAQTPSLLVSRRGYVYEFLSVGAPADASIEVFDVRGALVHAHPETPFGGTQWDASSVASGVYFVRLVHKTRGTLASHRLVHLPD